MGYMDGLNDFVFQDGPQLWNRVQEVVEKPVPFISVDWARLKKLYVYDWYREKFNKFSDNTCFTNQYGRVVSEYFANVWIDTTICKALGVSSLFVWQPIANYEYDLNYHPFNHQISGMHWAAPHGYGVVSNLYFSGQTPSNFIWLADIQKGVQMPLYVDSFHYNAMFCDAIAQLILQEILKSSSVSPL